MKTKTICCSVICWLIFFSALGQMNGDYKSNGAVSLNQATNWQVYNGSWVAATLAPNGNVASGNTITILPNHTWSNTAAATIPAGVTLENQGVVGSFNTSNKIILSGTYIHFTTGQAATVIDGMSIQSASTFIYRGGLNNSGANITPSTSFAKTFGNLSFDGTGAVTNPAPGTPGTVNGIFTLGSGWSLTLTHSTKPITLNFNGDMVVNGNLTVKDVTLASSKTLTVANTGIFSATSGYTLTTNSNSNIVIAVGGRINIYGTWENKSSTNFTTPVGSTLALHSGGTYKHNTNGGYIKFTAVADNSTIEVLGCTGTLATLPSYCGNVIWNCTGQSANNTFLNSHTTISGNFTVKSTGSGKLHQKGGATTRNLIINGNFNLEGGTYRIIAETGTSDQALNINGDLNISGGAFIVSDATVAAKGTVYIGGNLNHTVGNFGGSASAAEGNSVICFNTNNTEKTIATTGFANDVTIEIDKTATGNIALATNLVLSAKSKLNITSGTFSLNGHQLKLSSTATGSAIVGPVMGIMDQSVSGSSVVHERYIPAKRAWRLLTSPLTGTNTIYASWQNSGVYEAGKGTFITGTGGTNGLDNGGYSMKTYNVATQLLEPVTSTNITLSAAAGSADNKPYFLFVRGDRNPLNLTPPNTNSTTLSSTGLLQTGTQNFEVAALAGHYAAVGNPYAAPINFNSLTRNNVIKRFYAWDATLNNVGAYVLVDDADDDGTYSVTPPSSQTSIIQPGQAFFVQTLADGAASLTFEESHKTSVTSLSSFKTAGTANALNISLHRKITDTSSIMADGCRIEFNAAFSNDVNIQDAAKLINMNENLFIKNNSAKLALERRKKNIGSDTVQLAITNTITGNYSFEFIPVGFDPDQTAWLLDAYTHSALPVALSSATNIGFSVNADTASFSANRFKIVFTTSATLPVNFIFVSAQQNTGKIDIRWKVVNEPEAKVYEVERSKNARQWQKIGEVQPKQNTVAAADYSFTDFQPLNGNSYYRVKLQGLGFVHCSSVVSAGHTELNGVTVYPNQAKNKVHIQFNNLPKAVYAVQLYSVDGKMLLQQNIHHNGDVAVYELTAIAFSKGIYWLVITSEGKQKVNASVIFQ